MSIFGDLLKRANLTSNESLEKYGEGYRDLNQDEINLVNTPIVKDNIIKTIKSAVESEVSKNIGAPVKVSKIDFSNKVPFTVKITTEPIKFAPRVFKSVNITGYSVSSEVLDDKTLELVFVLNTICETLDSTNYTFGLCKIVSSFDLETGKVIKTDLNMAK